MYWIPSPHFPFIPSLSSLNSTHPLLAFITYTHLTALLFQPFFSPLPFTLHPPFTVLLPSFSHPPPLPLHLSSSDSPFPSSPETPFFLLLFPSFPHPFSPSHPPPLPGPARLVLLSLLTLPSRTRQTRLTYCGQHQAILFLSWASLSPPLHTQRQFDFACCPLLFVCSCRYSLGLLLYAGTTGYSMLVLDGPCSSICVQTDWLNRLWIVICI